MGDIPKQHGLEGGAPLPAWGFAERGDGWGVQRAEHSSGRGPGSGSLGSPILPWIPGEVLLIPGPPFPHCALKTRETTVCSCGVAVRVDGCVRGQNLAGHLVNSEKHQ